MAAAKKKPEESAETKPAEAQPSVPAAVEASDKAEAEREDAEERIRDLSSELNDVKREITALKAKEASLQHQIRRLHQPRLVRTAHQRSVALADSLHTPSEATKRFEAAVEKALDDLGLDGSVIENRTIAERAVRAKQRGR